MRVFPGLTRLLAAATCMSLLTVVTYAQSNAQPNFTVQTFANGTDINSTAPDPVSFGDGSLWVSYTNGADSKGQGGASTIVRYGLNGVVQNQWSIAGSVDGLRVAPDGTVWALQNQDGNSTLTTINPITNATTLYTYGNTYTNVANRGFDDAAFLGSNTFLSYTNPTGPNDVIVAQLTSGLNSPLQISGILNSQFIGTDLATGHQTIDTLNDPDSLIRRPNGDLVLSGGDDKQVVFIHNAGLNNQSVSFLNLLDQNGKTIQGKVDDVAFPTATGGYFFVADTGANKVYVITATGLSNNDVFVDVGKVFGMLDLSTGIVTPLFTGISPHGLEFVPFSEAPEPGTLGSLLGGVMVCGGVVARRLRGLS